MTPGHPDAFDHIHGMLADAGSIHQAKDHAIYIERFLDGIAGSARYLTYNGSLLIEQGIQQGALAGIWPADDGDADTMLHHVSIPEGVNQLPGELFRFLYEVI